MPPVGYIAYIDEAGDDGLRQIKTQNQPGASEWLVISAVVVKAEREPEVLSWTKEIVSAMAQHQLTHLHYAKLPSDKKVLACEMLAELPLRIFVVLSHKRNMQNYHNIRAEQSRVNRTARFYTWVSRIPLEKVTRYCGRRTFRDYKETRIIRFEFSDRGGVKLDDVQAYYRLLRDQSSMRMMHNTFDDLDWRVVDVSKMFSYPNKMRAGLQLADIAASAFFGGLEITPQGNTNSRPAKILGQRMAKNRQGKAFNFGVKLMPGWLTRLPTQQAELIDYYRNK